MSVLYFHNHEDIQDENTSTARSPSVTAKPVSASIAPSRLTPASIVADLPLLDNPQVPKARTQPSVVDPEAFERERGNTEFNAGNFPLAVKCYTKCLGLKVSVLLQQPHMSCYHWTDCDTYTYTLYA
jgi:hypothetical protein